MLEHFNPKSMQSAGGGVAVEIKVCFRKESAYVFFKFFVDSQHV